MEKINEDLFMFIEEHRNDDPKGLLLSLYGKDLPFSLPFAITQIEARKKNASKIPSFLSNTGFLFPDPVSAEQATDERVARFHSQLAGSGKKVLDLTAGLGIDAMSCTMNGNTVTACEINPLKSEILVYNAKCKGLRNFVVHNTDCCEFLRDNKEYFDIVYIDPARRDSNNNRTYSLADCEPDVLKLMPLIMSSTEHLMIKVSPLLDISKLIGEIENLQKIYAVCVKGECKELLLQVKADASYEGYRVVDLGDDGVISDIEFSPEEICGDKTDINADNKLAHEEESYTYLYEPNAGVMKLPQKKVLVCHYPDLIQVGRSTALFFSNEYYPDFPGRILKINRFLDKKNSRELAGSRLNVATRNYPLKPDELRKKFKLKEGDDAFLYAFRMGIKDKPVMCIANKIK